MSKNSAPVFHYMSTIAAACLCVACGKSEAPAAADKTKPAEATRPSDRKADEKQAVEAKAPPAPAAPAPPAHAAAEVADKAQAAPAEEPNARPEAKEESEAGWDPNGVWAAADEPAGSARAPRDGEAPAVATPAPDGSGRAAVLGGGGTGGALAPGAAPAPVARAQAAEMGGVPSQPSSEHAKGKMGFAEKSERAAKADDTDARREKVRDDLAKKSTTGGFDRPGPGTGPKQFGEMEGAEGDLVREKKSSGHGPRYEPKIARPYTPQPFPRPTIVKRKPKAPPKSDRIVRPLPPKSHVYPRNARYTPNYLPGRGYLDGLASHLARPVKGLDLAGLGLGAVQPKAPSLPSPTARALDLVVDHQFPLVPSDGLTSTLRVRLRAAEGSPRPRPPLRLHLVIDSSGSMKGEAWKQVCAAMKDVATRLAPSDLLSVVIYDETARLLSSPVPGGLGAIDVAKKVCAIVPRKETNTYAGLAEGYAQARAWYSPLAVNRVLLLSDGMPTRGPTDLYSLTIGTSDALGRGITTSAVGIGSQFDALLMGRIASEGGGNFHFVRNLGGIAAVFTDELHVLTQEAAEAVEVRVRLDPRVQLAEVVGSEALGQAEAMRARSVEVATDQRLAREKGIGTDRARDLDAGVRFLIPSFRLGDEHTFVLNVRIPAGFGARRLASVELRYKDMLNGRNVYLHADPFVGVAKTRAEAEERANQEVTVAEARARSAWSLQRASEYLDPMNLGSIRSELYAAAQALSVAAGRAGDVAAQTESDRIRRMADLTGLGYGPTQHTQIASLYHYGWRTCGLTGWR